MRTTALLFSGLLIAPVCGAVSVWPVDSLVKVFADDAAGANQAPGNRWLIARNGHTTLQFAVRSPEPVEALNVSVKLKGKLRTEVRRVGYVNVRFSAEKTPPDEFVRRAPGSFPDPLYAEFPFRIEANQTQAVWITVFAPPSTAPGVYKGEVEFRSAKQRIARLPFEIEVAPALVPERQSLKVTNWFTFGKDGLAKHFDLTSDARYWDLLTHIAEVLADHKQNVILTPHLDLTDARVEDGVMKFDFTRLDRFIRIFEKAGAADLIEGAHLIGRATDYDSPLRIPAFVIAGDKVERQQLEPGDPRAEAYMKAYLPALYTHLKEKGWLPHYVQHVLDEAHGTEPPVYLRYVTLIRQLLPGVPTVDAIDQTAGLLGDACDIWVPQLGKFDDGMDTIRAHVAKGGQAWFYTCLFPQSRHLNRFIDYPLIKTRLLHWFNYRYDFTGFLHWGGNYWVADPFKETQPLLDNAHDVLPAGDAFITYPWREKNSLRSSIRFEAMRESIEDYELLRALAAKNPAKATELARKAIPEMTTYVRDVAEFRRLQAELYKAE